MAKKKTEAKKGSGNDYKAAAKSGEKPKYDASAIEKAAGAATAAVDEFELLASKLPKEAQEKLRDIKVKLDKFKEAVLAKFDKYIMGIALLPPPMPPQPGAGRRRLAIDPQAAATPSAMTRRARWPRLDAVAAHSADRPASTAATAVRVLGGTRRAR